VCHAVLQDPAFFRFLTRIDEELAAATRLGKFIASHHWLKHLSRISILHRRLVPRHRGHDPAARADHG